MSTPERASEPNEPTYTDPNISDPDAPLETNVQDRPVMDQHTAPIEDKIAGIIVQTRIDLPGESRERVLEVLHQRFVDAGIDADEATFQDAADQVFAN